jgi:hypothetical protein
MKTELQEHRQSSNERTADNADDTDDGARWQDKMPQPHAEQVRRLTNPTVINLEASYICDACGEEIVIPVDLSAGGSQEYVEDCPVCCRANVIHVEIDEAGNARAWAARE